jgi:hypothetical protein
MEEKPKRLSTETGAGGHQKGLDEALASVALWLNP